MLSFLRRRWNRLASDGQQAAAETKIFLRRAEHLLIAGGILAVAAGIMMLARDDGQIPAVAVLVVWVGLISGPIRRSVGWLLTVVALVLLVVDALV